MTPSRASRPGPGAGRPLPTDVRRLGAVALLALVVTVAATGCGLRLQTSPPAPLVPDAVEIVRQGATADAVALGVLATTAASGTTDPTLTALLGQVAAVSDQHLAALGGIYQAMPEATDEAETDGTVTDDTAADDTAADTAADPMSAPSPSAPQDAVDASQVVALLVETAARAQADASAVPDGPLARLLASVATARALLADALGPPAGVPTDGLDPAVTASFEVPPTLPGVTPTALVILVQSEDAMGMAWEVLAARSSDDARGYAEVRAALHRQRAQDWAELGSVQGTGLDPRRSSYALPTALTGIGADPAAVTAALATLESDLAQSYASLVVVAEPSGRSALIDALRDAARAAARLTGTVPAFPGLPERTG